MLRLAARLGAVNTACSRAQPAPTCVAVLASLQMSELLRLAPDYQPGLV